MLGLGLGLEAKKFAGLDLETSGLGLEAFGLGLVFLALVLFKAKVKVTNILPNTVYLGIITLTVHWYTSVIGTAIVRRQVLFGMMQLQAITTEFDLSLDLWPWPWSWP